MTSSNNKRKEPWRNDNRHYCEICNVWMDSNRQSIMLHENGRKHKENVEKNLDKKRKEKLEQEKNLKFLQSSLQKMEQAANSHFNITPTIVPSGMYAQHRPPPPQPVSSASSKANDKNEKKEWVARKKQRLEEKQKDKDASSDGEEPKPNKRKNIGIGEGTYEIDGNVYLEGTTFSEILEEDMPIQIWTGGVMASKEEKRMIDRERYWKNGLVTFVRRNKETTKVHVAYLAFPNDQEETTEKNINLNRIRILLGSDEKIPDTLEEARLLAMGGEEIQVEQKPTAAEVDEATGLTGWSTVTIKRTTVRQETKDERAKLRESRKQAFLEQESLQKEAEARRMEEAKVANADDSALGAFDVWGKGGYKGINIQKEAEITLADTAKTLAKGSSVAFKKKKKKPAARRNIRQTSADDD